ncbi:CLC4E protein, partial [Amia calva]|nr:CLC4E protein [Amia calva]
MELEEMPHKPAEGNSPAGSSAQTREGCEMYLYRVKMISLAVLCILLGTYVMFLKYHKDRCSELRDENRNLSETLAALKQYQDLHTRDCKPCPVGWELNDGKCYFFSTDGKNWDESRDDCVRKGGHLVIIGTEDEQRFLKRKIDNVAGNNYWIGLTDAAAEGVWRWVDNTPLGDLIFWATKKIGKDEPDNWTGENPLGEDCACLNSLTEPLHNWFDESCTNALRRICETKTLEKPN